MASSTTIPAPAGWPEGITVETDGSLLDGLSGAAFSTDKAYRYVLTRTWDAALPVMTWVMLNPSTADAAADDPTIKRCKAFARREGCGGIAVVNLFGLRATDPRALPEHADPVGPANDWFLRLHAQGASRAVAAWGAHGMLRGRAAEVARMLEAVPGIRLECLGVTKDGHPKHPLARGRERVPDDAPLVPWQVPS
jgi:hypothetical protein